MNRLSAKNLRGIWAGLTMSWDEQYRFDGETYAQNIKKIIAEKVHGIYTTGSSSEFYALEYTEFCAMVDIQAELCGQAQMPLQIGCCSDSTAKTIRLLEYVAGKQEVGAAQVTIPYWMELTDQELVQFFNDLHTACPEMPLVHYNIPRAKRFLHAQDYLKIMEVAPSLIGVKYTFGGSHFAEMQDDIALTPNLSYFAGENLLVSAMQIGARGSYSTLVFTDPRYTLDMYTKADTGRWDEAISMQQHVAGFYRELANFITQLGEGTMDPIVDKGLGIVSGFLHGHQRCRPPYIGWKDETILKVRQWLKQHYPEFLYPR